MIPVVSREEMRAFDAHAIKECKVPSLLLMENAGRGAADVIERQLFRGSAAGRRVVVVCGSGNNGGDGFVVARHLLTRGADVRVWLAGDPKKETPDCKANHAAYEGIGGKFAAKLGPADLVVDALFGTGLDRPITGALAQMIETINAADVPVAALDVPSGLDTNTGVPLGTCIEATLTVTFAHLKLGHVTGSGAALSGPVHVVDIGVPGSLRSEHAARPIEAVGRPRGARKARARHPWYRAARPRRAPRWLAGQDGRGAPRGAWRTPRRCRRGDGRDVARGGRGPRGADPRGDGAAARDGDARRAPREEEGGAHRARLRNGRRCAQGPSARAEDIPRPDRRRRRMCSRCLLARRGRSPPRSTAWSWTPHSGELGRLLGQDGDDIDANRFEAAKEAAKKTNAVVLLKGAYTVIASPEGEVVVTGSGSPALATAGSGDVLAGLVTALACTLAPFEAPAWAGAFLPRRRVGRLCGQKSTATAGCSRARSRASSPASSARSSAEPERVRSHAPAFRQTHAGVSGTMKTRVLRGFCGGIGAARVGVRGHRRCRPTLLRPRLLPMTRRPSSAGSSRSFRSCVGVRVGSPATP